MSKYPYISDNKCKNCNGDILIKRSRDKSNIFCSTKCVGKYCNTKEKEIVNCKLCNKGFVKTSKTKNIYCSIDCSNKSKKKIYNRYCKRCNKEFTCNNKAEIERGGSLYCSVSCSNRIYNFDHNYFTKIDTPNKAYILGFLYADGCINKKQTEMIIKIHNSDIEILNIIKKEMKSEHPIKIIKQKDREDQVRFGISSIKLCKDLSMFGLFPSKTFNIEFPKIIDNLNRHFIRGYFDGDGSISKIKNRNSYTVTIFTASEMFMKSLRQILYDNKIETNLYKRNNGYAIQFSRRELVDRFFHFIYQDADIFLKRKKYKFPNI
jgi:DNA-binding transcriptional regulator WhiA